MSESVRRTRATHSIVIGVFFSTFLNFPFSVVVVLRRHATTLRTEWKYGAFDCDFVVYFALFFVSHKEITKMNKARLLDLMHSIQVFAT